MTTLLYEYGTFRKGERARRNTTTGEVQFILWKAGEDGHDTDMWHAADSSWWGTFVPYENEITHTAPMVVELALWQLLLACSTGIGIYFMLILILRKI